jgi:hypothetical protein
MKIAICAIMVFAEKMVQIKGQLEEIGHTVFISQFAERIKAMVASGVEPVALLIIPYNSKYLIFPPTTYLQPHSFLPPCRRHIPLKISYFI